MLIHQRFLLLAFSFMPAMSFAFFCPTNFNQIDYGYTMDQVVTQCGKPDSQQESKRVEDNVPQEWSYYIPQAVSSTAMNKMQGTLKTQMTFDAEGRAINISVNGIGVGSTTICGRLVQLGDKKDMVKGVCGDPSFINKQTSSSTSSGNQQPEIPVVTFIYNTNPPVKLIFENGTLKEKQ